MDPTASLPSFRRWLAGLGVAAALALAALPAHAETVLKVIPQASLRVLDPIWTTGYITRNHGYLIYDTLFSLDPQLKPQPQMVDKWTVTDKGLKYTFTLRPGLKFHDGAPVTSRDVVASIKRWGARDSMGRKLMDFTASMEAVSANTFVINLKEPFGLVLDALAKPSSNVPFIMPERVAMTDPNKQIEDFTGSGPFVFVKEEFNPGSKAVYTKFKDYVPRKEPASLLAGGKVVKVDRVEWIYMPDANTAVAAMNAGEMDYYENPPIDLLPLLKANPKIKVDVTDPLGGNWCCGPISCCRPSTTPRRGKRSSTSRRSPTIWRRSWATPRPPSCAGPCSCAGRPMARRPVPPA